MRLSRFVVFDDPVLARFSKLLQDSILMLFDDGAMVEAGLSNGAYDEEAMSECARQKVGWAKAAATDATSASVKEHINESYGKIGIKDRSL